MLNIEAEPGMRLKKTRAMKTEKQMLQSSVINRQRRGNARRGKF